MVAPAISRSDANFHTLCEAMFRAVRNFVEAERDLGRDVSDVAGSVFSAFDNVLSETLARSELAGTEFPGDMNAATAIKNERRVIARQIIEPHLNAIIDEYVATIQQGSKSDGLA